MSFLCVKYHQNPSNGLGGVALTRKSIKNSQSSIISLFGCRTTIIFLHAHLCIMSFLCVKYHQNPSNSLGGVALTRKSIKNSRSWIISLSGCRTTNILLHAHLHIMSFLRVKFHQNPSSSLGGVALTSKSIKKSQSWIISLSGCLTTNYIASCTSTYHVLPLCKVSSKSVKRFRRSCANKKVWTDRRTDRRTDRVIPIYTPNFVCGGYNKLYN